MMSETVKLILSLSLSGSILAVLIFALKPFIKHKLSKAVQYYLWLVVLLRLLLPFSFESSLMNEVFYNDHSPALVTDEGQEHPSVYGTPADTGDVNYAAETGENPGSVVERSDVQEDIVDGVNHAETNHGRSNWDLLGSFALYFWMLGAAAVFLANIKGYAQFLRHVKAAYKPITAEEQRVLNTLLNGRRSVKAARNPYITTPMVIGLFKPLIIIPDIGFHERQIKNILLHEITHLKHFDIGVKWLTMTAASIHWFNPFMFLIRKEINHACELACDEAVIQNLNDHEKQAYGDTLISVVSGHKYPMGVLQATMSEDKRTLKERLIAIMKYGKKSKTIMILSVALLLSMISAAICLGAGVGVGENASSNSDFEARVQEPMTAFKGLELYVWRKPELTGIDDLYYTLLMGTNRNKTEDEVFDLDTAVSDLNDIKKELSRYSRDTYLFVMHSMDIDEKSMAEIKGLLSEVIREDRISIGKGNFDQLLETSNEMDESTKLEVKTPYHELMAYAVTMEELLNDSRFIDMTQEQTAASMRELPQIIKDNYDGIGRRENNSGYLILTCRAGGTPLPKDTKSYVFSPGETSEEQLVLEDAQGRELCKFPLGLEVHYYREKDIFLVLIGDDSPNITQITQIARHQLAGDQSYIEYAKQVRRRGTSLFRPQTYPYITVDIWINGSNLSQYVPVDLGFAQEMENRMENLGSTPYDKKNIIHTGISMEIGEEEQYSLCLLEDGTQAIHRWGELNAVFIDTEVYDSMMDIVKGRTPWEWISLSEIHDIVKAEMRMRLHTDSQEEIQIVEDRDALNELENLFAKAKYTGVGGCPYTAQLLLTRKDGKVISLQIATDSCDQMILGTSAGYDYGPEPRGENLEGTVNRQEVLMRIFDEVSWRQ